MKKLLDYRIYSQNIQDFIGCIDEFFENDRQCIVSFLDANMVVSAYKSNFLRKYLNDCNMVFADGYYVKIVSRLLNKSNVNQITGYDVAENILQYASKYRKKIYFLGTKQSNLNKIIHNVSSKFGSEIIAGFHHGYFDVIDADEIVENINNSSADIIFLGMPSPKREKFISMYKSRINSILILPIGGVFDIWSGHVKRSPLYFRVLGLEWFHRFCSEPFKMWKRVVIVYPFFVLIAAKEYAAKSFFSR